MTLSGLEQSHAKLKQISNVKALAPWFEDPSFARIELTLQKVLWIPFQVADYCLQGNSTMQLFNLKVYHHFCFPIFKSHCDILLGT